MNFTVMKKFTRGHCYVISCVIFYVLLNNVLSVILCGFRGALKHISCIFQVSVDWNQHPLITVIDKDTFLRIDCWENLHLWLIKDRLVIVHSVNHNKKKTHNQFVLTVWSSLYYNVYVPLIREVVEIKYGF